MVDRPRRALVVTPHPDDAEIGCGGAVATWTGLGTDVVYVLCANGDRGTSDPELNEREGLEPHKVGEVLLWGSEEPDVFVEITDVIEVKIDALKRHKSQVSSGGSHRDVGEFVKSQARRVGERAEAPYAEAFRSIRFRA